MWNLPFYCWSHENEFHTLYPQSPRSQMLQIQSPWKEKKVNAVQSESFPLFWPQKGKCLKGC